MVGIVPLTVALFVVRADMPSQMLCDYAREANLSVIFSARVNQHRIHPFAGPSNVGRALEVILAGSGLKYIFTDENTVSITEEDPASLVATPARRKRRQSVPLRDDSDQLCVCARSIYDRTISFAPWCWQGDSLEYRPDLCR